MTLLRPTRTHGSRRKQTDLDNTIEWDDFDKERLESIGRDLRTAFAGDITAPRVEYLGPLPLEQAVDSQVRALASAFLDSIMLGTRAILQPPLCSIRGLAVSRHHGQLKLAAEPSSHPARPGMPYFQD